MRGAQAIAGIFPSAIDTKPEQKSHRNVFIDRRDDALAARFYFYFHIKRLRYDDCLLNMESEFFITSRVISERLVLRADYMKELINRETQAADLRKLFPFYAWN